MKEKLSLWMRLASLRQLRGLIAIAETGTMSAAARQLNLTPPAVSLQLRELEKAAGAPLFERVGQRFGLTLAGQEVHATALKIELLLRECDEALDDISGIDRGHVAIGVVSTARYFVPMALAAFKSRFPRVKLQLQVGNRVEILSALEKLEIDFVVSGQPPTNFEVISECIGAHPQVIITAPDHHLAHSRQVKLANLADEPFLLREPGSGTRAMADHMFATAGVELSNATEFGSNETIKQAVMAGFGIALISGHTVAAELRDRRLASIDVEGLPRDRNWFVVRHAKKRLLPSSQALWDFLVESVADYLPDPQAPV